MSTTIDQQVVEMRFDNKNFENNIATTMSSLEKFRQKLNLSGATKGLENIDAASKKINMSSLGAAVDQVGIKFNALWTIADQALRNIVNSAMGAGKQIVSALTLDPIKTGLSEYETRINAVQTILANTESKGTTLQQVNSALDTLNTYADKTIYNFTEMTRNIGTFTAAGVDLNTSVNAIQGIANLAAVSGSTSQQASTAMYQLSQALSSGTVKLMDWNSVVNAGMGGQVFQDALKETAKVHGVNVDKMIKKHGSFRETLQEGWITSDILTETLSHFTMAAEEGSEAWNKYKKSLMADGYTEKQAEAILKMSNTATAAATKVKTATQLWDTLKETVQSGWTQTWELILGDFGEAKKLFSGIYETLSPILEASSEARNKLLSEGLSTGWKQLLGEGIADEEGYKDSIKSIAKEHGVVIDDMIAAEKKLDDSLDDNEAFQKVLKKGLSDGTITSDMLSKSVTKLADKMRGMSDAEMEAAGYTKEHLTQIEELEKGLKDGSISMDEFVKKMQRPSGRENLIEALMNAFNGLMSVIKPVKEAFRDIFPAMTGEQLYAITEKIRDFTAKLTIGETASNNLKRTFKGLFAILDIGNKLFFALIDLISPLFGKMDDLGGGILGMTAKWGDWLVTLNDSIDKTNFFSKAVEKIHKAIAKAVEKIHGAFIKVKEFIQPAIDGLKRFGESFKTTFSEISSNAEERLGPITALGNFIKNIFVAAGKVVAKVFPFISAAATGIGNVFKDLMGRITESIQGADYEKMFDMANGGILAAIGVFIAKFIKSGGNVLDSAGGFLDSIKDIFGGVTDCLGSLQESIKADVLKKIAISIGILAASLLVLSFIDSDKLTDSLIAIAVLFGELMGAMKIFGNMDVGKNIGKVSTTLIKLAAAIFVLSLGLKIMSTMSWSEMGVGLISLTVGLGALVGAVNLLPDKKVKGAAKAIKTMSSAILILAVGIKIMSTMSWEEMGIGLITMVVGLGALVGAVNLLPKDTALRAAGMIALATAMVILGAALKIMATMSWDDIGRSLVVLAGSLAILAGAMALMKKAIPGALAMRIIAPALLALAGVLKIMATMSWEQIAKGLAVLGGSLVIIAGAMALMKKAIPGAAALVIVAASLAVLTPVLRTLGSMSLAEIGKSLLMLAGVFTVFGIAAATLKPVIPSMLKLAGAFMLLGVACAAIGAGVLMVGLGITALAGALASSGTAIVVFVSSLISLIPYLIEQVGVGIIKLCEVIAGGASSICEAVTVIILAIVDALVASVPSLVEGAFVLIIELLKSLVAHAPMIVTYLFDFIVGIINALAAKLPDLIQASVNLIMSLFQGVIDALKNVDPTVLVNGILAIGMVSALMVALATCAALAPAAMVGVLAVGAVVAELGMLFAAMGALAQIPGLDWLISEGGSLMQTIGTAIGQFLGGIVGGFAQGMTAGLPQIGADLSAFMINATPFIDGAKMIDASALDGVYSLVGIITALTAANILDGLTSWFTGGTSLTKFGKEIATFAPYIRTYADTVAGIDASAVTASATAAQALAEMTSNIPNEGGVAAWFAGENSISKFGQELVALGVCLSAYSLVITGFNAEAVIASANAAQALADMTSTIPNEGGVAAWFAGENSISKWGKELVSLGMSLAMYSFSIMGFNAEAVIASANAAQALVDMTSKIPNEGGMVAWFTGENSVASWGQQLVTLGNSLAMYSNSITGFNAEAVIASANAAQALVDMTSNIPNEGGVAAWFAGENSISKFGAELISLGLGLMGFSVAVAGINVDNVTAATGAAKTLAEMAATVPNEGGVAAWFAGENSLSKFSTDIILLGEGLKGFSDAVEGINAENVTAAAGAAKSLAEMASIIPNEGGIKAWFAGDNSVSSFGDKLPVLGDGLKGFSDAVAGIVPGNIVAAANAAKSLAEMANTAPKNTDKIVKFGENLVSFGDKLKSYFEKMSGVSADTISASTKAINAVKDASSGLKGTNFSNAADAIDQLVESINKMSKVKSSAADEFSSAIKKLANTNINAMIKAFKGAGSDMKNAGKDLMAKFIEGVESQNSQIVKAGKAAIEKFIEAIKAQESKAKTACKRLVSSCATAISDYSSKFKSAGKDLGAGLIIGINSKKTAVYNAAYALGQKAVQGEKDGQKSKSPSKATIQSGNWLGEGLIIGIKQMFRKVYNTSFALGERATETISSAISRISESISNDIDTQPTIRPILDLSDVRSGASALSGMLNTGSSIGVRANLAAISSTIGHRGQNGFNEEVVSAINKLRKDIANIRGGDTYQLNGLTYDDGSSVSDAIKEIARYMKIEGRV